jgi:Fe-S cluster assembly ATP-binding protein
VETGGVELAHELHQYGYDLIRKTYPDADAANRAMVEKEETAGV